MTIASPTPTPSSEYDEPIWDEGLLALIDDIESKSLARPLRAPTHLTIECEEDKNEIFPSTPPSQQLATLTLTSPMKKMTNGSWLAKSLYERYRSKRGFLSVSDIVSCAWCETQVEYGLLGKRYLPPSQRPTSIWTAAGTEIKVSAELMISRQKVLDGGIAVHTKLEKEVAPEKADIKVVTAVDNWGLKILNSIINFSSLRVAGLTREMSVWGFIGDFLVLGIIDQIELDPKPVHTQPKPNRPGTLDHFLSKSSTTQASETIERSESSFQSRQSILISDSKTRQGNTLPPILFTHSARYQLMLYKFLYDQLASRSLDFSKLCDRLSLDPDESFSPVFLNELPAILTTDRAPQNLREMFELLESELVELGGVSDNRLEIVYRTRDSAAEPSKKTTKGRKRKKIEHEVPRAASSFFSGRLIRLSEDEQLAQTIANSLADFQPRVASEAIETIKPAELSLTALTGSEALEKSAEVSLTTSSGPQPINPAPEAVTKTLSFPADDLSHSDQSLTESSNGQQQARRAPTKKRSPSACPSPPMPNQPVSSSKPPQAEPTAETNGASVSYARKGKGIIGSVLFQYDHSELQKFVGEALAFWNGDRAARGVPLTEIDRCGPCEFQSGCEWRAMKAGEALASAQETMAKKAQA
ncbi:hypothetical protein CROQUDRAFT_661034 [Cronartium quercuum f. sp. fusiforme G11]|uniref:Exonuclease V n=1 Tax=Cronartium quercuum f. sp. fusiforme G11 TaxID=708437 RepID=A0A9P6NCV1_9BASI|nr:hypothetical protein CROQUDRAFT_661034 [Cronartium quercuum f. sp. fusiforme G11]